MTADSRPSIDPGGHHGQGRAPAAAAIGTGRCLGVTKASAPDHDLVTGFPGG
jgi:hypothetical protein